MSLEEYADAMAAAAAAKMYSGRAQEAAEAAARHAASPQRSSRVGHFSRSSAVQLLPSVLFVAYLQLRCWYGSQNGHGTLCMVVHMQLLSSCP